jgi:hypothetical protein
MMSTSAFVMREDARVLRLRFTVVAIAIYGRRGTDLRLYPLVQSFRLGLRAHVAVGVGDWTWTWDPGPGTSPLIPVV